MSTREKLYLSALSLLTVFFLFCAAVAFFSG